MRKEMPKFEIKGGSVEGQTLNAAAVDSLSKSAGRVETIGQIAGLAAVPWRSVGGLFQESWWQVGWPVEDVV